MRRRGWGLGSIHAFLKTVFGGALGAIFQSSMDLGRVLGRQNGSQNQFLSVFFECFFGTNFDIDFSSF